MNQHNVPSYRDPSEGFLLAPCGMLPDVPLWEPKNLDLRKQVEDIRPRFGETPMSDLLHVCSHPESNVRQLIIYREYEAFVVFMESEAK